MRRVCNVGSKTILGTSKLKSRSSPYLIDNFSIFYYFTGLS
uniref:Uncharacterized protein n=1 Tax=Anguilla anguilla TaxID=7936 RepID=A0A0E9PRH4_ANGAN